MADITTLAAEARAVAGRGPARAVRRTGNVPGVVYGSKKAPELIQMDRREIEREMGRGGFFARLYDLKVNGSTQRVLPRDVGLDPVTDRPISVDFLRLTPESRVTVHVPMELRDHDKSPGIKKGGVVNIVRHTIELVCRADSIPEKIVGSLEGFDIGDSLHISAIKLPEGVRPTIARNFTIASVAPPTVVRDEAVAPAAAEAAAAAAAAPATGAGAGAAPGSAPKAAPGAAAAPAAGGKAPAAGAKAPAAKPAGKK